MQTYSNDALHRGIRSGLLNFDPDDQTNLAPTLVLNEHNGGQKVLSYVLNSIEQCIHFRFAVAFITTSGVACIHQTLKDAVARGCTGEILVSQYLNFSDPLAIERLRQFRGVNVRFTNEDDFHGKLYFFAFKNFSRLLLGSSNLTQAALGKNTEINLNLSISNTSGLHQQVSTNLDNWIKNTQPINDAELASYAETWKQQRDLRLPSKLLAPIFKEPSHFVAIKANSMQIEALKKLQEVRDNGYQRTLVISATGTGKTVLSALDVKNFGAKRLLFVVHRLNIAKKAMLEYRKVFGASKTMGLYSGNDTSGLNADFIFATVQTIKSDHHLSRFDPETFDYIIIDESHHAGALTYQKILGHFRPKFLLGMTATPERTDGFNIFELFDYSIAYEIRLHDALKANLLAPFHYFGVSDITLDGVALGDKAQFNKLISPLRVNHIIKALKEYGCSDGVPRGLVFCSKVEEANQLAQLFNEANINSVSLSGINSEAEREAAIQQLESQDPANRISYIFTVDIFNEGIDIPSVNQVVMLRPTESAIIFVQQLGRGLRKTDLKEYLTVIDFIGNYESNFLVPAALFGDASFNKDKLRRLMAAGSNLMPGESSISFDRIAKERIFNSISKAKVDGRKALVSDYELLKFRLGRHPKMLDFLNQNQRDPFQYVKNYGSLLNYRLTLDSKNHVAPILLKLLRYLSEFVFDGIRPEESIIFLQLQNGSVDVTYKTIKDDVENRFGYRPTDATITSALHSLNLKFITEVVNGKHTSIADRWGYSIIHSEGSKIFCGDTLKVLLEDKLTDEYLIDAAEYSIEKFIEDFRLEDFVDGFKRGSKYSRRDVFRILRWSQNPNAQNVGGYIVSSDKTQCPIFVNYHKDESITDTTKYEDYFESTSSLIYMSKNRRTLSSPDVKAISNQIVNNMRIPIFVKKSNDEGFSFYFLGDGSAQADRFVETTMATDSNSVVSVVQMTLKLDKPITVDLFKYITDPPSQ
jgi:superfamily II DNA or RNA helicase